MDSDLVIDEAAWAVLSETGLAFFDALVEHLANACNTAAAFVVESFDPAGVRVCPLTSWGMDNFREGRCYNTIGTPCERLRRGVPGIYPDRLKERFPGDDWLQTTEMQSYVGLPLLDRAGNVLGHIGVLHDQPLEDPQSIAARLEAFVPRCRSELARTRRDIGLTRLTGNQPWVLYRAVPPQFAASMISPDGTGILGFSQEELRTYDDLRCRQLFEEDRERVLAAFAAAMETGEDFVVEYRLWEKERNRLRRFQDCGHVECDQQGNPTVIAGILVDITERPASEEGRPLAERPILARPGDLPAILFRCDSDPAWTMRAVSGAVRRLTGFGADELKDNRRASYCSLIHPEDRERVFARRREALDGKGYQIDYRLIDAHGDEHLVAEAGQRSSNDDGPGTDAAATLEGVLIDLAEQQTAQSDLRESEAKFRAISLAAHDGVITVDEHARIAFWNPSAERIFGYTAAEAAGQEIHTLLAPFSRRAKALRGVHQFGRTGQGPVIGQTLRLDALHKDGAEFPIDLSISSVQVRGRWHAIGIVRDVSERERALTEARESEARFRALFDHAADGLLIADPVTGRFIAGNHRMSELLGYSREELEGLSVTDLHRAQDLPAEMERFRAFATDGQGKATAVPMLRKDGSVFEADVSSYTIKLDGKDYLVGAFRDVTPEKLAHRQIAEEHQKLRSYLDSVPLVTVVFDPAGTLQMVNRRACELLGRRAEDIVGKNWLQDFVPEAERERVTRHVTACFTEHSRDNCTVEFWLRDHSDSPRRFCWTNEVIQDRTGRVVSVISTGDDVTESRQMEQDLQSARERLEFVVRAVPAVLYACNPDDAFAITFVGANLSSQFGIDPERVLSRSGLWLDRAHPTDIARLEEGSELLMANGHFSHEFRLRLNGAKYRWVQMELRLIREDDDQSLEAVGYVLDITERKQAEQALRDEEARLSRAQAIAHLGSWESNLIDGSEHWSDEVFRIFGYGPNAFRPTRDSLVERVHPDDVPLFQQQMERALSTDAGFNFEFRILRQDEQERYVRARGEIHRDEKGRGARIEGTLLDFTERKQIELSLERSKQMLKQLAGHLQSVREEERSAIAREIHDELGQSLTALKIDLVRLRSHLGEPAPAVDALLQSMIEGVSTTLDTVQQLMSQLRPSILDNLGLIPAIGWQAEQFRERTGIDCSFTGPGCELALTPAASTALFRILQESLTNVARHAGASRVSVELKRDERWVKLSIQDNGRGITDLEQQSSASFGLLGMRERAEVFGGQVEFHRPAGRGTQVLVSVPASAVSGWSSHA